MKHRINWGHQARIDVLLIRQYLSVKAGRPVARRIAGRLFSAVDQLQSMPRIGRIGARVGTRELTSVQPYIIVYRIDGDTGSLEDRLGDVEILRIWHGAQDRAPDDPPRE
ncbi:MAG TPA: type II toxin-antitoxin system RelE/ParE family toxin [Azospirillum sp.]|nr:type II toxin-antitoxin system RelE/ParE family toxin [Azospirillum sp.]